MLPVGYERVCHDGAHSTVYLYQDYVLKHTDISEFESVWRGTAILQEAGVSVLPILEDWQDEDGSWWFVQPRAEMDVPYSNEVCDLIVAAFAAGVGDMYPDNVGMWQGQLVVVDPGYVLDEWEWNPMHQPHRVLAGWAPLV